MGIQTEDYCTLISSIASNSIERCCEKMADIRGVSGMDCNDKCGCTVPCPGGVSCRCSNKDSTASGGEHKTCSCPESAAAGGAGRGSCQCGAGCSCSTCQA